MLRHALRFCGFSLLALFGLLLLLYGIFAVSMLVTERRWLGDAPFHAAIDSHSTAEHQLTLIDGGAHSLAYRLQVIAAAQESLELEFFIYELDAASRLVTQALVAKAAQGVRVRILVDFSIAVFSLRPAYAQALEAAGIDVRYYNTASVARLFSVQHRTHRKLLIADGKRAMIGGRNIADAYFDLSPTYNFLDSDVLVEGEIVHAMRESFDLYWESRWAALPGKEADIGSDQKAHKALAAGSANADDNRATDFLLVGAADRALQDSLQVLTGTLPSHPCSDLRFVTDYPGLGARNRRVYRAITETLQGARQRVLAESPYFVLRDDGLQALRQLTDRNVKLTVLTNSLYSTDAYYTVGPLYLSLSTLADAGLHLRAYRGAAPATTPGFPGSQRWGVHSKRAVVDDRTILIGTYNIDPRSANLNSEMMVVCADSPGLAQQMAADLESRLDQAAVVIADDGVQSQALLGAASWQDMLLMTLVAPVASLFDILL